MIYLDYAAATPMDDRVKAAQEPYFSNLFFNPSASYQSARKVRDDYENARHALAQTIGSRSAEIIITAGATESINLALAGVSGQILTTNIEHASVLSFAESKNSKIVEVDNRGIVQLNELTDAITDETELISIGYANSEIGSVQPIKEIAAIVAKTREKRLESGVDRQLLDAGGGLGHAPHRAGDAAGQRQDARGRRDRRTQSHCPSLTHRALQRNSRPQY